MPPRKRTDPNQPTTPLKVDLPSFQPPTPTPEPVSPPAAEYLARKQEQNQETPAPAAKKPTVSPMASLREKLSSAAASTLYGPEGRTTTSDSRTESFKTVKERIPLDPESALKATIAVVGLAVIAGSWIVRAQSRRNLRKPTPKQTQAIAEPISKIFARHFDMGGMAPDLLNGVEAAVAVNDYVMDGALVIGPEIKTGVPKGDPNHQDVNHVR